MAWENASNDEIDLALDHFSGLMSAVTARLCELIREADVRQVWMADGARSLTDWVSTKLRVRHGTGRQLVGVARRLADLPNLSRRLAAGELTLDQVDAISRFAIPDTESRLADEAAALSNAALDRRARRLRGLSEQEARDVFERRRLIRQWNLDQSELRFNGRLPGVEGRIFDEAIDSRVDRMPPNPETGMFDPFQTRSADALIEMAATDGDDMAPSMLTVNADLEALTTRVQGAAELDNTALIPNSIAQRLACDAVVETIIRDGPKVIGIGRKSRKVPPSLRRLVYERDGGCCQFPGCANTRWLQIHHIVPWALGGPTDLDNLIALCGFHHRFVHERGWHVTGPPRDRVFRRPDWTLYPRPRPPLHPRLAELVSI